MRRGFTLVEVLVALGLLAALVAVIAGVLIQQSLTSSKQQLQRDLEERGRLATVALVKSVQMAGYGIDPPAAFDFDRYACGTPGTASTCRSGGRDQTAAPDELVVSYRDPAFFRNVTGLVGGAAGPWTVQLDRPLTKAIAAGRIVQLLCSGADPASYTAVGNAANTGDTQLTLRALTNADGYYPQLNPTDACFNASALMLVERDRYWIDVDPFDGVPALWRERGLGNNELVARGIEDLQLAYTIGAPPATSPFAPGGVSPAVPPAACGAGTGWIFGLCTTTAGTPIETAPAPDWRNDSYDSVNRYTGNPANIRSVTLSVVARSTQPSPDRAGDGVPALANRAARAADRFSRAVLTVTQPTPNMLTRARFLPPVFTGSNVGGG